LGKKAAADFIERAADGPSVKLNVAAYLDALASRPDLYYLEEEEEPSA